jgi:hypothetical protein
MDISKILKKCIKSNYKNTYSAYLQPQEMMILIKEGAYLTERDFRTKEEYKNTIERIQTDIDNGICNPTWYGFYLPKKLEPAEKTHDCK